MEKILNKLGIICVFTTIPFALYGRFDITTLLNIIATIFMFTGLCIEAYKEAKETKELEKMKQIYDVLFQKPSEEYKNKLKRDQKIFKELSGK